MSKCYCCETQAASPIFTKDYGVPMCGLCHLGICLLHWGKPSKKAIDENRDKMFNSISRLENAWQKQGVTWSDPRKYIAPEGKANE